MTDESLSATIAELKARADITEVCHRYCRALDRVDDPLLRSVFHPNSTHQHGPFRGSSSDFCGFAIELLRELVRTQHLLGNVSVELKGDVAYVESYFQAYHRIARGKEGAGVFVRHDKSVDEDIIIGGRYIDRFERRAGVWKIAHRTGLHEWEQWSKADERHFPLMGPDEIGRRDRSDPVYRGRS
jgi:hypothetical protein